MTSETINETCRNRNPCSGGGGAQLEETTMDTNGKRRGPRHVASPARATRLAARIRRELAAEAARLLYPNPKKAAPRVDRSVRTIQRWRSEDDASGSPIYHALEAMEASDDPAEAEALFRALEAWKRGKLAEQSLQELAATYHELRAEDARLEGKDNVNKVRIGIGWTSRFFCNAADAQVDIWLGAFALEFARRGVSEGEVFGEVGR